MSQSGRQKQSDINVPACNVVNECPLAVDIAIESTDGQVFGAHTKNLEVFNRAFPATDSVVHDKPSDIVKLSESSDTLQLLLKFSHNEEHGDISEMGLDKVLEFAAAADKYGNSIAMPGVQSGE
ncbi:hypothetical protein MPER_10828 [Moniliophthora perniciosa FA553]|nr:hypothetical protein MPER_10828 [Moniliophthora perniciosa FA553]